LAYLLNNRMAYSTLSFLIIPNTHNKSSLLNYPEIVKITLELLLMLGF
jgi:hypothetical protein